MHLAAEVAEIGGPAASARADDDSRAHWLASVIFPVCASARSIERIDFSALAADERPAADYGRLCDRAGRARESEGPFQLEARHIFRVESGHRRRLKPMLRGIDAPSVPMRLVQRLDEGRVLVGAGPAPAGPAPVSCARTSIEPVRQSAPASPRIAQILRSRNVMSPGSPRCFLDQSRGRSEGGPVASAVAKRKGYK